jgi:4'-phosphopantetheinyl transferase
MRCSDQREDVEKFFKLMKRQFTDREWEIINAGHDNVKKMRTFYRLWCLKESFIKAKGTGLNWNLQRLNFEIHSELPSKEGAFVTDTVLYVDKLIQRDWTFQEIILDADHCVCVAVGRPNSCPPAPFTLLETMNELIDVSELISDSDSHAEFRHYQAMEAVKPF